MTIAAIGLGGNVGDPRTTMGQALDRLHALPGISVEAVSGLYETPPWGKTDQPAFLNAAARLQSCLPARGLLDALLSVEAGLGRMREELWGPRTVDLDLLLFGTSEINEAGLHVPHPRLHERAFALRPLADVMGGELLAGRSISDWLELADTGGIVRLAGPDWWRLPASPVAPMPP
jgi:2-amino-4-hydroxy-6-hydroxymethyldihydropteridine diphosphokinase